LAASQADHGNALHALQRWACEMTEKQFSYQEWLALNPAEREAVRRTWNVYSGENIHIPREAGRRLKERSPLPIQEIRIGIYHGGVYVLNPQLWAKDLKDAPPWLQQEFDGFPVGYCEHDPTTRWDNEE
jgi:hypothetical protein